jgi:hypothetical protein
MTANKRRAETSKKALQRRWVEDAQVHIYMHIYVYVVYICLLDVSALFLLAVI